MAFRIKLCFEASAFSDSTFEEQNILSFSDSEIFSNSAGSIKIKGNDSPSFTPYYVLDSSELEASGYLYDQPNILTLVESYNSDSQQKNLIIRQNGIEIGDLNSFDDKWLGDYLRIGDNPGNQGIKYYDLFCFTGILSDAEIGYYEKYLFENYFNTKGLYFAKFDVPQGLRYSPLTREGGQYYWTREINDLFKISYGSSASFAAQLVHLNFGDGYESNLSRNINSLKVSFDLIYDGLTDKEAKCLIAFFENAPEKDKKSYYEDFAGVNIDLFSPYKYGAEVYFKEINHSSSYSNINRITIKGESLYETNLDYKGMVVRLDEINIKTYKDYLEDFSYNDVFYLEHEDYDKRGYYFYIGPEIKNSQLQEDNKPLGNESYFTKHFYFKPDLDYVIDSEIRLLSVELDGSTKQYKKDGLNYNLMSFSLKFSKRSNEEARAILKFLDDRAGFKLFTYTLPQPYNKKIAVYCPEWNHVYNYFNNNDITVKFKEFKGTDLVQVNEDGEIVFSKDIVEIKPIFNTKISFVKP